MGSPKTSLVPVGLWSCGPHHAREASVIGESAVMPRPPKPELPPAKLLSGCIRADELNTLPELQRRLGIRQAAWRALRRKGLPFHQVGKRVLVFGQDFFEFVRKQN